MVTVVKFLQLVEPSPLVLCCIDMMKSIVRNVVGDIANQHERPKAGIEDRICHYDHSHQETHNHQEVNDQEKGDRQHQTVSRLTTTYGSLGSM